MSNLKDSVNSQNSKSNDSSNANINKSPSNSTLAGKSSNQTKTVKPRNGKTDHGNFSNNQSKESLNGGVKLDSANEAGSTKPTTDSVNQSSMNTASSDSSSKESGDFDVINLVKGDSSKDPHITNVGDDIYYTLETLHANREADPVENRDGFKTLVRFSKVSKRISVKLNNKVSDGQHGIANRTTNVIDNARRRATGGNVKSATGINNITYPDVMNFVSSFNVSGHIPLPDFKKVTEWTLDSEFQVVPSKFTTDRRILKNLKLKDAKVNISTDHDIDSSDEKKDLDSKNLNLETNNLIKKNTKLGYEYSNFPFELNYFDGDMALKDSFCNDISTYNYFTDFKKIQTNINTAALDHGNNTIPELLKTSNFIYSKILSDVDFATLVAIILDSYNNSKAWFNVLQSKLGIADSTLKAFEKVRAAMIRDGIDRAQSLKTIFKYIPINKRVFDAWKFLSTPSQSGINNVEMEGNLLNIPHFQILGNFFKTTGLTEVNVRASSVAPLLRVPLVNLTSEILNRTYKFINEGVVPNADKNKWHIGNKQLHPSGAENNDNDSIASISSARCTTFMFNFIFSAAFKNDIMNYIETYFMNYADYYNLLNSTGLYNDTNFSFIEPASLDFSTTPDVNFIDVSNHYFALREIFPSLGKKSTIPLITPDINKSGYHNWEHIISYDAESESTSIQKLIKAFVVDNIVDNNGNSVNVNGLATNNIKSNLNSIVVLDSLVIPFIASKEHTFSMNIVPSAAANYITFTKNANQYVYQTALMFEFSAWNNHFAYTTNYSDYRPHIANVDLANNYYLCSDNLYAFMGNSTALKFLKEYKNLFPYVAKPQTIRDSYNSVISLYGLFGYTDPHATTYTPYWLTGPFGSTSLQEFTVGGNRYLTKSDFKIEE